jgi:hypothetical protein
VGGKNDSSVCSIKVHVQSENESEQKREKKKKVKKREREKGVQGNRLAVNSRPPVVRQKSNFFILEKKTLRRSQS